MQEKEVKEVKFEFYNEKLLEFRKNKNLSQEEAIIFEKEKTEDGKHDISVPMLSTAKRSTTPSTEVLIKK